MSRFARAFGGAHAGKDVDALLRSALLATLDRDLDRAEDLLTQAVRIDSDGVESYLALGRLFRMRGEIGRAIRIHQNLLLRSDLDADARIASLLDLAADFRQGGFLRRAITTMEEVVARQPKNAAALRTLLGLLTDARDFPRASLVARQLARLEGRSGVTLEAELYVEMAEVARREGRLDDARKAVKRALRKNRQLIDGWIALGGIEAERGRHKAALAAWKRVPALDVRSGSRVYAQIESALAKLGRDGDFEKLLRELLTEHPGDAGAGLALARHLAARGDAEAALGELRRMREDDPQALDVRAALGRVLLAEGRDSEAAGELGELLDVLENRGLLQPNEALE